MIEARAGAKERRLTTTTADEGGRLSWSPDGRTIAYLLGDELKYSAYDQNRLAVIPAAGGPSRILTDTLDRPVRAPLWTGGRLDSLHGRRRPVRIHRAGSPALAAGSSRLVTGQRVVNSFSAGPDGGLAVIASTPREVPEIYALEAGKLRQLSHQNDDWFKTLQLSTTEEFYGHRKDGTDVHGLIVKPITFLPGRRYPALLQNSRRPQRSGLERVELRARAASPPTVTSSST